MVPDVVDKQLLCILSDTQSPGSSPGVKIIFRVGLVLLKSMLGTREKLKACQGQYETMELLRAIEPRYMQEGFLVREVTAEENVFWVTSWQA